MDDTDYTLLHDCADCGKTHRLAEYPVNGGYVVAAVCQCRGRGGLPRRYSTETEVLDSLGKASIRKHYLLGAERLAA